MTVTHPRDIQARDSIFKIPMVLADEIELVTDEAICNNLAAAYSAGVPNGHVPSNLYVVRMGSGHYVVLDPAHKAGQFSIVKIFNTEYSLVGGWTGG